MGTMRSSLVLPLLLSGVAGFSPLVGIGGVGWIQAPPHSSHRGPGSSSSSSGSSSSSSNLLLAPPAPPQWPATALGRGPGRGPAPLHAFVPGVMPTELPAFDFDMASVDAGIVLLQSGTSLFAAGTWPCGRGW